jgi:hypothetical protein
MKTFFEAIEFLFVKILFYPMDLFRELEINHWWSANIVNWIFIIICIAANVYWMKQLKIFKASGEDEQDTTAHSFLK